LLDSKRNPATERKKGRKEVEAETAETAEDKKERREKRN
jgi:hypothetical protein